MADANRWFRNRPGRALMAVLIAVGLTPAMAAGAQPTDLGAVTLTGSVEIEADELATYSEPFAMLFDAAVIGNNAVPQTASQIAAGLVADGDTYSFALSLPVAPVGIPHNIAGPDTNEMPLVYSVDIIANMTGTPFLEEADFWGGDLRMFSSLDSGAAGLSGQLAVWSAGDGAEFPTGTGPDEEALTGDDPTTELDAGWTIVDLTEDPYGFDRDSAVEIAFPADSVSPNDFTDLGYTDAFDKLVDQLEAEYAFTDVKDIDFDALREEFRPLVQDAEADDDRDAYATALYRFALAFGDGHVGAIQPRVWLTENYGGSYGLTLGQADDGTVYVIGVVEDGATDGIGIEPGDVVTEWDGEPVQDVLDAMLLPETASSDFAIERKKVRWLTRGPIDSTVEIGYSDGDGDEQSAELTAAEDIDGLVATLGPPTETNPGSLPLTAEVLPSGVGYIRISSFDVDLVLFTHAWDYALRNFEDLGVTELVIDVRSNYGGFAPLSFYATASFVEEPFVVDEAWYPDGDGGYDFAFDEYAVAGPDQWDGAVAVLVDEDCISTCELFAGTMEAIDRDDISIVGFTPSAGVYAAVQFWDMPDDLYFQASALRFELDGEIYLEESGVPVDLDVPVTEDTLLSPDDAVLDAAVELVQE